MPDLAKHELSAAALRWRCDPATLGFACTNEISAPKSFIGQERAVAALEFGLNIQAPGYNIFVTGMPGTGKSSVIKSHIKLAVDREVARHGPPATFDWCYVFNFERADSPDAVRLPRGGGAEFVREIGELRDNLARELSVAYKDESYNAEIKKLTEGSVVKRRELMLATEKLAGARGFAIQAGPTGILVIPIVDEKPLDQARYIKMSDEQRAALDAVRREVSAAVEEAVKNVQQLEQEHAKEISDLDRKVAEHTIEAPFQRLRSKYQAVPDALRFLDGLREFTLVSVHLLRSHPDESDHDDEAAGPAREQHLRVDAGLPFRVNLFVDNSKTEGQPIVVEDNPTYPRLFGQLERRPVMGTYVTDHTMLKPGSLVLANGGYLVMDALAVLLHPGVWPALKRVLKGGEVRPEDPADSVIPGLFPHGLRPEAIPIQIKVVISGDPELYDLLAMADPDFWEIFKVHADLDFRMRMSPQAISDSRFICGVCNDRKLKHLSSEATALMVEQGSRLVNDQDRLSTRFGLLVDLIVEASYWAERDGASMVGMSHVERAIEQKVYRSSRVSDAIQQMMVEGTLIVSLDGRVVGQVNGLAIYSTGSQSFGKPSRITASASVGRTGVVNIEREAQLSGQTHDKGVLIMSGYLRSQFAQEHPLAVDISIAFEQSYGVVDGDSASSTELYAILSRLSGLPIRQDIAVTGSVNQLGEIQPIGGVNEKIEGYFDLCRAAGKLGGAGVIIPSRNVRNLMIRPDVVDACRQEKFHIYAVANVSEGIGVLTGIEAGEKDASGRFPPASVNGKAAAALGAFADKQRRYLDRGA